MATSQPTEIQAEGEIHVDEAVKEILAEMEAEEQDPIEGMGNAQIAEIYHRMKPEDQRLFRQFKKFHKHYYVSKKQRRHTLSGCLTMPTCVPSTPGELPSCQRTSCWQDKSGESVRRVPPQKQTSRSFSGPPPYSKRSSL